MARRASFSDAVTSRAEVPVKVDQHRFITRYRSEQKEAETSKGSFAESKSDSEVPGAKLDKIQFTAISERSPTGGDTTVITVGSPIIETPPKRVVEDAVKPVSPSKPEKHHVKQQSRELSCSVITVATDETAMLTDLIENIRMKEAGQKAMIPEGKYSSVEIPGSMLSFASSGAGATAGVTLPEIRMSSDDLQKSKDYPTLTLRMRTPNRRDMEEGGAQNSPTEVRVGTPSDSIRIAGLKPSKRTKTPRDLQPRVPLIAKVVLGLLAVLLIGATVALAVLFATQSRTPAATVSTVLLATSGESKSRVLKTGFATLLNVTSSKVDVSLDSSQGNSTYNYFVVIDDADYVPQLQAAALSGDLTLSSLMSISKIQVPSQNLEITVCSIGYAGSDCSSCHPLFTKVDGKCSFF